MTRSRVAAFFSSLSFFVIAALVAGVAVGALAQEADAPVATAALEAVEALGQVWLNALRMTVIPLVFFAFRVMVALGLLMIGLGLSSLVLRLRGRLYDTPWLLRAAIAMGPAGLLAVTAGWIVTEAGRQPFTVYGHLTTANSVAPIGAPAVATSLVAFAIVYFIVFGAGIWFLFRLFSQTPQAHEEGPPTDKPIRSAGTTPAPSARRWSRPTSCRPARRG